MNYTTRITVGALPILAMAQLTASATVTFVNTSSSDGANKTLNKLLFGVPDADPSNPAMVPANRVDDDNDQLYSISSLTTLIIEIAGNSAQNQFGVYDPFDKTLLPIYPGSDQSYPDAGDPKAITLSGSTITAPSGSLVLKNSGTQFGFYLKNESSGTIFYSQSGQNASTKDQLVTFQNWTAGSIGSVPLSGFDLILAWEDVLTTGGDRDFNDMLVGLTVPEPSTYVAAALLGIPAIIGFARTTRRRQPVA